MPNSRGARGMRRKVVVMALIPGGIRRAPPTRSDLGYAKYSRATWEWWCERHSADFIVIEAPPGDIAYAQMPPTLQRWALVDQLIEERGENAQVALVDADTMIRWDTPDIFEQARGFSAVADASAPSWIVRSTRAFQHLFPDTSLVWWEYFNSGIIVLGAAQRRVAVGARAPGLHGDGDVLPDPGEHLRHPVPPLEHGGLARLEDASHEPDS